MQVLIISSTDSIRSQMASAFLQCYSRARAKIYSAGLQAGKLHPMAVQVMQEIGIDISNQKSNSIEDYDLMEFDFIGTICNEAKHNGPYLSTKAIKLHQHMKRDFDPASSKEEQLKSFRKMRDDAQIYAHKFSKIHLKGIRDYKNIDQSLRKLKQPSAVTKKRLLLRVNDEVIEYKGI